MQLPSPLIKQLAHWYASYLDFTLAEILSNISSITATVVIGIWILKYRKGRIAKFQSEQ
jgi:hypothetical protein